MIVKRTKSATQTRGVMNWANSYIDETKKHAMEDISSLGMQIGKMYFTSRPVGSISAHGYAKKKVDAITMTKGIRGNEAVLSFLSEHCRLQKMRKRKVLGLRLIMSLDPAKTVELADNLVDIDRLLVKTIEDSFERLSDLYYNGDRLGFILGVHHDAVTKADGTRPSRPHIHAHVFVLPQTEQGLRVSLSNHTVPGRDGQFVQMLDELRFNYQDLVIKHIYNLHLSPEPEPSREWATIVKESTSHAIADILEGPKMEPSTSRRWLLDRATYYLRSTDREMYRRRYNIRMEQLRDAAKRDPVEHWTEIAEVLDETINVLGSRFRENSGLFDAQIKEIREERPAPSMLWNFKSPMGVLVPRPSRVGKNRKDKIRSLFREVELRRWANRLNMVGEQAIQEIELAASLSEVKAPEWVDNLGAIASNPAIQLPNYDILDKETKLPETISIPRVEPAKVAITEPASTPGSGKF